MKKNDFKFLVLAVLCLLLVFPIIGYVQKQAAAGQQAETGIQAQRDRRRFQRQALRDWLQHSVPVAVVTTAPGDPHVFEVILKPEVTPAEAVFQAGRVQDIMMTYFQEGRSGAVTLVNLHVNQGQGVISVLAGIPEKGTFPGSAWHIFSGHKLIK